MNEVALAVEVLLASVIVIEHVGGRLLSRRRLRRPIVIDRR